MSQKGSSNSFIIWIPIFLKLSVPDGFKIDNFEYRDKDSKDFVNSLFDGTNGLEALGSITLKSLTNQPYFISKFEYNGEGNFMDFINNEIAFLDDLISHLWYIKDNCCHCYSFIAYKQDSKGFIISHTKENYSKANLTRETELYSYEDIGMAYAILLKSNKLMSKLEDQVQTTEYENKDGVSLRTTHVLYNKFNRIERALGFLEKARESKTLPIKISFYTLVLECLFSANDSVEIQHKLGERLAIYMGTSYEDKVSIYTEFKVWYNIRSKYIHGQIIEGYENKKEEKLYDESVKADSFVRKVLIKVLTINSDKFLLSSTEQRKWFDSLLFGKQELSIEATVDED